jgi:hypothetical protein
MPRISALRRLRQEGHKLQASLNCKTLSEKNKLKQTKPEMTPAVTM